MEGSDFLANDICYPYMEFDEFVDFKKATSISDVVFPGYSFTGLYTNWEYTFSIWVRIDENSCF